MNLRVKEGEMDIQNVEIAERMKGGIELRECRKQMSGLGAKLFFTAIEKAVELIELDGRA